MVVDTNIFIDFFKGETAAKTFFSQETHLSTSIIVLMEIIAGLSTKARVRKFEQLIRSGNIQVYSITDAISKKAYEFFKQYYHTTHIDIPDAFIAATAIVNEEKLSTLNSKHFKPIKELTIEKPY